MTLLPLLLGIFIFVGGHLVTRLTGLRHKAIASVGINTYKGLYSLVAVMGLALIAHGFGVYRAAGYIPVWQPPAFMTHAVIPLVFVAFVLLVATYLPGRIRRATKHPTLVAVKVWALAHLLVNGDFGSMLLFSGMMAWAVIARIGVKRAGDAGATTAGPLRNDLIAVAAGAALTLAFILGIHHWLIGVPILPGVGV